VSGARKWTCGEAQRSPLSCTRERYHHGVCVTESGMEHHRPHVTHADDCPGCQPEFSAIEQRNRKLHPERFR